VLSCGGFEPDGLDECIKVIDDPVVQAVEKRPLLVRDSGIGANGAEETRGKRGVDAFEQLQEHQADRVSLREELIAAGVWKLGDETLGPELGQVVAERGKRIAFGGTSERLDDVRMEFCGGEAVAGGDVRKAHEGVHQGKLAGMMEAQSRNALACRSNGRFGEAPQLAAINEGLEDILLHVEIIIVNCREGVLERRQVVYRFVHAIVVDVVARRLVRRMR